MKNMQNPTKTILTGLMLFALFISACKIPSIMQRDANKAVPSTYRGQQDSLNSARLSWKEFFTDPYLIALIDTALKNNQELNIILQEINISRNEIQARKGEYLPFLRGFAAADVVKTPRFTPAGASEATTDIEPGRAMPDPVPNTMLGAYATWELDIWHKLRNAKEAAMKRYLASIEGKQYMVTRLVSEIANSYYELLALDKQMEILQQNITIQSSALEIVKLQKQAARVTELAVKKFEAEVYHTRSMQFDIQQQIIEAENRINFLVGRFPQPVARSQGKFDELQPTVLHQGLPSQLLENRPDIRQAELELAASHLDVKSAKANFYPSLGISASLGLQAFNPAYLVKMPESILFSMAGDLMAPLVNRNAIKATYLNANARQIQAAYNYEQTLLNAYIEVVNQLAKMENLANSYDLKTKEVEALTASINISNGLFTSARADYMEVLMTQRDALRSKFELVETKKLQLNAMVNTYQALGGGWN